MRKITIPPVVLQKNLPATLLQPETYRELAEETLEAGILIDSVSMTEDVFGEPLYYFRASSDGKNWYAYNSYVSPQ